MKWVIFVPKFNLDGTIDLWLSWSKLIRLDYLFFTCRKSIFLDFDGKN